MSSREELAERIAAYTPPVAAAELLRKVPILLLTGPSGVGKNTVMDRLLTLGGFGKVISTTTRPPRTNNGTPERDGVDYHFTTLLGAEEMLVGGSFIEADLYAGNIYGTTVQAVLEAAEGGRTALADVTAPGADRYLALAPHTTVVCLVPPSLDDLKNRYIARSGPNLDPNVLAKRLWTAGGELAAAATKGAVHLVVNERIDGTVECVNQLAAGFFAPEGGIAASGIALAVSNQIRKEFESGTLDV